MSDTPHLLVDCQRWYGEENGLRIYNKHRDTLHRIDTSPTEIKLRPIKIGTRLLIEQTVDILSRVRDALILPANERVTAKEINELIANYRCTGK